MTEVDIYCLEKRIEFALVAIYTYAINYSEFKEWIAYLINTQDELPPFFYSLYECSTTSEIHKILRDSLKITAGSGLSKEEREVLYGLALKRGMFHKEYASITPKTALKRLEQYPHVVERFRQEFPFIEF
jgi:hypothetical protein